MQKNDELILKIEDMGVDGVLGGMIASAVSGKIAGALVEEDRVMAK